MNDGAEYDADLIILGSGSTAFAAGIRARELEKNSIMIEDRTLGGTCVNRGCLPSKNLIEAARIVHDARNPRFPGLSTIGAGLEIDFGSLINQKDDVIKDYRKKKYDSLVGGRMSVVEGHARFIDSETVQAGDKQLRSKRFVVATGSRPVIPEIPGLTDVPYLTSDLLTHGEEMELRELPPSLIIIGGGYIALELGQMFARLGSTVTIVLREGQFLASGYEPQLGKEIGWALEAEGVTVVRNAIIENVRSDNADQIVVETNRGGIKEQVRAEKLLVATGRRPNTDDIGLDTLGVNVDDDWVVVDEHLRTNLPHIFAAGDVIGRHLNNHMATPVGARQGKIAAQNALDGNDLTPFDGRVIPRAIFTDPQIGVVGMTEAEVIQAGHRCWCTTLPMEIVPRAGATRDTRGFIKMVADADTNEVLGVTMMAPNAAEVIHEAAMAMHFRAKIEDFVELIHVYPTMAEAMKIIALARTKNPWELSCCAE